MGRKVFGAGTAATIVAAIFAILRAVLPDLDIPVALEEAVIAIVVFIVGFFVQETAATKARMKEA